MRRPSQLAGAIAKALMTRPLSITEIAVAVGLAAKASENVKTYVDEWRDLGLIYISAWTYMYTPIYRWQPSPFEFDDVPKPPTKKQQKQARGAAMRAEREQLRQCV